MIGDDPTERIMKRKALGRVISSLMASKLTAEIMHGLGSPFSVGLAYHGTTLESKHGVDNMFGKHTIPGSERSFDLYSSLRIDWSTRPVIRPDNQGARIN
jgi:hypothetical protein